MGRKPGKGPSVRGYFIKLLNENPQFLSRERGTNEAILKQWQADHPNETLSSKVKTSMANAKSFLQKKKEAGESGAPKKRGRPKKVHSAAAVAAPAAAAAVKVAKSAPVNSMALEIAIDDCMIAAAQLGQPNLGKFIEQLREARRALIKLS